MQVAVTAPVELYLPRECYWQARFGAGSCSGMSTQHSSQPVLTLESLQEHRGAHRTHTTKMPAQTEPQQLPLNPKLKRNSNSSNLNFSHFCAFVSVFRAPTNKATDTMPPPRETQTQLLPSAPSPSPLYSAKQIVL